MSAANSPSSDKPATKDTILLVAKDNPCDPFERFSGGFHKKYTPENITWVNSLNSATDLLRHRRYSRVVVEEDITVGSEHHPVESTVGWSVVLMCIKLNIKVALIVSEQSFFFNPDPAKINLKFNPDPSKINPAENNELAYIMTPAHLADESCRNSVEMTFFGVRP